MSPCPCISLRRHPGHEVVLPPVAGSAIHLPHPVGLCCQGLWGRGGSWSGSWACGCRHGAGRCSRLWPLLLPMPGLRCSRSLSRSSRPPLGHMKPSGYSACYTQTLRSRPSPQVPSIVWVWHQAMRRVGVGRLLQGVLGEEGPQFRYFRLPPYLRECFYGFIPFHVPFRSFDFSVSNLGFKSEINVKHHFKKSTM